MKKVVIVVLILLFILGGVLTVRFLFGGDEDTWICSAGHWVKHGNPSSTMPQKPCPE